MNPISAMVVSLGVKWAFEQISAGVTPDKITSLQTSFKAFIKAKVPNLGIDNVIDSLGVPFIQAVGQVLEDQADLAGVVNALVTHNAGTAEQLFISALSTVASPELKSILAMLGPVAPGASATAAA